MIFENAFDLKCSLYLIQKIKTRLDRNDEDDDCAFVRENPKRLCSDRLYVIMLTSMFTFVYFFRAFSRLPWGKGSGALICCLYEES